MKEVTTSEIERVDVGENWVKNNSLRPVYIKQPGKPEVKLLPGETLVFTSSAIEDCTVCFVSEHDKLKTCDCGVANEKPHKCPYQEEIHDNHDIFCACCVSCTRDCQDSI